MRRSHSLRCLGSTMILAVQFPASMYWRLSSRCHQVHVKAPLGHVSGSRNVSRQRISYRQPPKEDHTILQIAVNLRENRLILFIYKPLAKMENYVRAVRVLSALYVLAQGGIFKILLTCGSKLPFAVRACLALLCCRIRQRESEAQHAAFR